MGHQFTSKASRAVTRLLLSAPELDLSILGPFFPKAPYVITLSRFYPIFYGTITLKKNQILIWPCECRIQIHLVLPSWTFDVMTYVTWERCTCTEMKKCINASSFWDIFWKAFDNNLLLSYAARSYMPNIYTPPLYLHYFIILSPLFFKLSLSLSVPSRTYITPEWWIGTKWNKDFHLCYAFDNNNNNNILKIRRVKEWFKNSICTSVLFMCFVACDLSCHSQPII